MATVTMSDIARELGVSAMTVSRSLRGVGRVSAVTRARVRATARRLGYVGPQEGVLGAPAHRGTSDHCLRLVLPVFGHRPQELSGLLSRALLAGLRQRLAVNRGSLTVVNCAGLDDVLGAWEEHGATGLVLRRRLPSAWLPTLTARGPVVYASSHDFAPGVDAAYANELRAAATVVDTLRQSGHREVAWFQLHDTRDSRDCWWADADSVADSMIAGIHGPRYAAWAYITQSEPRLRHHVVRAVRHSERETLRTVVEAQIDSLRITAPEVTCIVCPNDFAAAAFLRWLPRHGRRVPDDLSIVSYGGTRIAQGTRLPLTALELPMFTIGRALPDLIERRLADPDAEPLTLLFEAPLRPGATLKTIAKH